MRYESIQTVISDENGREYTVYGVSAQEGNEEVFRMENVFLSAEKARIFTEKCNRNHLSVLHAEECIQDAVEENA